jgi:signal transduction histidine kinase
MRSRSPLAVRPVDAVVTAVLVGLGIELMIENIASHDSSTRIDSHSWWIVPLFVVAFVPVVWWRRGLPVVAGLAVVVMAVHVVTFGWMVRCGAGLPLAFVLAYLAGMRDTWRRGLPTLVMVEALTALVLLRDSVAGPGLIPVAVLLTAGAWAIGQVVRQRIGLTEELRHRNEELSRLRDARAAADVNSDRARMSAELDALLDERLAHLSRAASTPTHDDPDRTGALLAMIEADSRRVLEQMRQIVGALRGGEVSLSPAPSVAHLEGLLSRRSQADARLAVSGDPRSLPASVELSAYRVVEHVLGVLADEPDTRIDVAMHFTDAALEISMSGPVHRGADVRAAVARARERVRLQHGTLTVKVARGRARVLAHLPVQPA